MKKGQRLPSETLMKPTRRVPWIIGGAAALAITASAVAFGPAVASQLNPAPAATPTIVAVATADAPLTDDELSSIEHSAELQHATIVAEAQAAADAAAAQAAADQAAAQAQAAAGSASHSTSSGPIHCPAGSSANSNDGVNDTSCFPTICFGITVPDPAHPECDVAFKP